ncbi:MAG: S8 family serine peptidase [Gammaproteobacteria bacterium]|nr:S8 family serine peptidase [Gammaproteobacteria bacterium]
MIQEDISDLLPDVEGAQTRKYFVISNEGLDVTEIDNDLESIERTPETIPNRSVVKGFPFYASKRVTEFMLTDDEAETLKSDGRVLNVELSPEERDDIELVNYATQEGNFTRKGHTVNDRPDLRNWALRRHSSETNPYTKNGTDVTTSQGANDSYSYELAGEGVDIVICDTGISGSHPDFHDEHGNSRVQKIHWETVLKATGYDGGFSTDPFSVMMNRPEKFYTEHLESHGTCSASVAAGNLGGFAKKAHIYLAKNYIFRLLAGSNGTPRPHEWYDRILHWHKNKGNNRPTVMTNSFGYTQQVDRSAITAGNYQGTAWTRTNETDDELTDLYGIDYGENPTNDHYQIELFSMNALIEEMTAAGIHMIVSAGNYRVRLVTPDHIDYNNYFIHSSTAAYATQVYYTRPSLSGKDAIIVGAIDNDIDATSGKDKLASFTNRGEGVDLYAAGWGCAAAGSVEYEDSQWPQYEYPFDTNYPAQFYAGTSCAGPIVAGVAACYLSARPNLSPKRLKKILIEDAKVGQIEEVAGGYHTPEAFLDSHNRVLFNKYNNSAGATFDGGDHTASVLGGDFAISTTFTAAAAIGSSVAYTGFGLGFGGGSIKNASFASINENGTIEMLKAYWNNQAGGKTIITLKVKGKDIENTGWSILRTSRIGYRGSNSYDHVFYRKDAIWTEHLGTWEWTIEDKLIYARGAEYALGIT